MATSYALKEQGNTAFRAGDFKTAEELYSKAIRKDPSNPALFTNRAFTRIKLASWDAVIDDCIKAIELQPDNMKGYYYLAQAQIALHHPNEALNSAMTAYGICLKTHDSSTSNISNLILQAKKEKWEAKERERIRRRSDLLRELEDSLTRNSDRQMWEAEQKIKNLELDESEAKEEKEEIQASTRRKMKEIRSIFALSDPENLKNREVPDYLIDNISFAIMHDPIVTRTGNSYDRSTLLEHLKRSNTDPLTREPLTRDDLRPNLALKQACAEFLEENGWAVDCCSSDGSMDPVSVVALVGFGLQAIDTIQKLLAFLDQVKDAPSSVLRLTSELQILEGIVNTTIKDDKQRLEDASERTFKAYQKALEAVSQQCQALLTLLEKTLAKHGMSRRKRLLNSLNYVFREEEFTKLVEDLERAKSSFQLAQLCITNEASARNNRLIQQTNLQLYALTQAIIQNGDLSAVSDASNFSLTAFKMLSLGSISNANGGSKRVERPSSESTELAQELQEAIPVSPEDSLAPAHASETSHQPTGTTLDTSTSQIADRPGPPSSLIELYPGGFEYLQLQDRFSILKTKTEMTIFHAPLLGTVVVTRRKTVTKHWNSQSQQNETEQQRVQTSIRVRPAPWLFSTAYEIRAEEIISRYGSCNLSIVLEPLRYARISGSIDATIGDLAGLQTILTERKFSIKDRDEYTGNNLLGLYLDALEGDWFHAECNPLVPEVEEATHRADIVRTCRWLVSQGLTHDFKADDSFINSCMHLGAPKNKTDAFKQVQEYESLLLESTDSGPCIPRAKMLLLFGCSNPDHSQRLRSTVVDLIQEAAVDHGPEILAAEEKRFWADQDIFTADGVSVIASSMLQLARIPKHSKRTMRRKALKGPRRMLYRWLTDETFLTGCQLQSQQGMEDASRDIANLLGLCRSLALLSDGFGEHLFRVIRKNDSVKNLHVLELWRAGLKKANYDPDCFEYPERSTISPTEGSDAESKRGDVHCSGTTNHLSQSGELRYEHALVQPEHEIPSWTDLDAVTEYFTSLELAPDPAEESQPPEAQSKSIVSRIATVGLELVTSLV